MQSLLPRKLSNGSRRHFLLQVMLSHNLSTVGKVGCKHLLQGVRNCRWSGSHTSFKRRITRRLVFLRPDTVSRCLRQQLLPRSRLCLKKPTYKIGMGGLASRSCGHSNGSQLARATVSDHKDAQGRPCPHTQEKTTSPQLKNARAGRTKPEFAHQGGACWRGSDQEAQGDELLSGSWHILGGAITAAAVERQ